MTTPMQLAQALNSLKTAADMVRVLREADTALRGADLKLKISDLADALADARMAVLEAQEEIQRLQTRVSELERAKEIEGELVNRSGVHYRVVDGKDAGGLYCVRCFEADKALRTVRRTPPAFNVFGQYECPQCKSMA